MSTPNDDTSSDQSGDQRAFSVPSRPHLSHGQREESHTRHHDQNKNDHHSAVPTHGHIQHQHGAANVARAQAEHIYRTDPPHQLESQQVTISPTYDREHKGAENYDWREYHTAWQQYYQQYYSKYYVSELERQKQHTILPASAPETLTSGDGDATNARETPGDKLRKELQGKVASRAKKLRSSTHFMPIVTALIVGSAFFLLQFNKVIAAEASAFISPSTTVSDNVIVDPNATAAVTNEPRLIIPKINVDVPVVYGLTSLDNNSTQKALESGVAHYPIPGANSLPGQTGNNVILGHSSNDVLKPGSFKFAFVLLERLQKDDVFYIHYQGKRYVYKVSEKKVINPDQVSQLVKPNDKPIATLVTCTPIGTAKQRLLVFADQISPDPKEAAKNEQAGQSRQGASIPGNEPSILERLFGQ